MAATLGGPRFLGRNPLLVSDRRKGKPTSGSSYVIDPVEYVSPTPLPPNDIFDEPDVLARMLASSQKRIKDRPATSPAE